MEFEAYLEMKRIDRRLFQSADPNRYEQWYIAYNELGNVSFTARYLYQINPIRRKYRLLPTAVTEAKPRPLSGKPIISRPKPNLS